MFELPSLDNVKKVTVDQSVIEDGARPLYVYVDDTRNAAQSS
jgi:ATP-dependent protease Clp ATPase subunit